MMVAFAPRKASYIRATRMKPSPLGKVAAKPTDEVSYTAKIIEMLSVVTQPHPPLPRSPFPKGEGFIRATAVYKRPIKTQAIRGQFDVSL